MRYRKKKKNLKKPSPRGLVLGLRTIYWPCLSRCGILGGSVLVTGMDLKVSEAHARPGLSLPTE